MLTATNAELQFHMYRLGSRTKVARLYGVRSDTIYRALPMNDTIRFMSGQMVSIGGILCKRCSICGTARELESYWVNDNKVSGCDGPCKSCRKAKSKSQLN